MTTAARDQTILFACVYQEPPMGRWGDGAMGRLGDGGSNITVNRVDVSSSGNAEDNESASDYTSPHKGAIQYPLQINASAKYFYRILAL